MLNRGKQVASGSPLSMKTSILGDDFPQIDQIFVDDYPEMKTEKQKEMEKFLASWSGYMEELQSNELDRQVLLNRVAGLNTQLEAIWFSDHQVIERRNSENIHSSTV